MCRGDAVLAARGRAPCRLINATIVAVAWMRERYHDLPLGYVGHSFDGRDQRRTRRSIQFS